MDKKTNSSTVAAVCGLLAISAYLWQSWSGGLIFMVGFSAGAVGTVINLWRRDHLQKELPTGNLAPEGETPLPIESQEN